MLAVPTLLLKVGLSMCARYTLGQQLISDAFLLAA